MPFIGTDDGYWYSLQEKNRIMAVTTAQIDTPTRFKPASLLAI